MKQRKFKDHMLQRCYYLARDFGRDPTSSFYVEGLPHRGASHRAAYWNGRGGQINRYQRNSQAYAFWAAGQDDLRDFGMVPGWDFGHADMRRRVS